MAQKAVSISAEKATLALLRLMVAEREERAEPSLADRRTELLLDDIGLSYQEIAAVVGKNPNAVRMLISRSRKDS